MQSIRILLAFLCLLDVPAQAASERPNVLFIIADDFGVMDVGMEEGKFYETPHLDGLARGGMRFTQGYSACCVCSPSRASLFLGQYPTRHGITDWIGAGIGQEFAAKRRVKLLVPDYERTLSSKHDTLAGSLAKAGYKTFFAGKWHLGGEKASPELRGFQINRGGWDSGSPDGGYFSPWNNPKLPSGPPGQSLDQRLADETISFIEQNSKQPFFACLSFYSVHGPLQTSRARWEKFRRKASSLPAIEERFKIDRTLPVRQVRDNPVYAGMIEEMDDAIGRVLGKLEELGLDRNTIIVFTGDNGGVSSGDSYSTSALPLRGGKGRQWEGGIRVPYCIKVPGMTPPGGICATPVSGIDFHPTLLELAGVPREPGMTVDGVSLVPLLKGASIAPRPLFWHYPHYGNQGGEPHSIIREGDWKLIHYWEDGRNELYQLAADLGEQHDLAKAESPRAEELWKKLQEWLKSTEARTPGPNPKYEASWEIQHRKSSLELKQKLEKEHARFLDPEWQPDPTWWDSELGGQ